MTRPEIEKGVLGALEAESGLEDLSLTDRLVEDLKMDSLDAVEFAMTLEDAFGIDIADEEFEECRTIDDVVGVVAKQEPHGFDVNATWPF